MAFYPGFGVTGYRSFFGDPQWINLDARITVLLGQNNAGKSNIMRLLTTHLPQLTSAAMNRAATSTFDAALDTPKGVEPHAPRFWIPLDPKLITDQSSGRTQLADAASLLSLVPDRPSVCIEATRFGEQFAIGATAASASDRTTFSGWGQLSSQFTSMSGGPRGADAIRVATTLAQLCAARLPSAVLVPPFREIRPKLEGALPNAKSNWDFSGSGLKDRLAHIKQPGHDGDEERQIDQRLTDGLRSLFDDPRLEYGTPSGDADLTIKLERLSH